METMVSGWMPRAGLLLLPLLLCFGPETAGSIRLTVLSAIVDHVDTYGVEHQYAFAVSLSRTYCENTSDLKKALPEAELAKMKNVINQESGLYDPDQGNIVAARVNELPNNPWEHAEWRLLQGGQNSPVEKLLARTYKENSCLIFFTLNSPCTERCLAENRPYSILPMVNKTFSPIDNNYKAFVFRQIFQKDWKLDPKRLLEAWLQLPNVSPHRCYNYRCFDCRWKDPNSNKNACLDGM